MELDGSLTQLGVIIAAVGGLGAAAYGLVDVTKGAWIVIPGTGFNFINAALKPFAPALANAVGSQASWTEMMWSHWINGRDKADQKTVAKSLIRIGLDSKNADEVAAVVQIDGGVLKGIIAKLNSGEDLQPPEFNLLGRLDATIDARLDAAFERADRRYRSVARNLAGIVAVALAIVAGAALFGGCPAPTAADACSANTDFWNHLFSADYVSSSDFLLSIVVGVIAVPIAPISKDLVSALSAAMQAVKAAKG